jgi:hypothetical protein
MASPKACAGLDDLATGPVATMMLGDPRGSHQNRGARGRRSGRGVMSIAGGDKQRCALF